MSPPSAVAGGAFNPLLLRTVQWPPCLRGQGPSPRNVRGAAPLGVFHICSPRWSQFLLLCLHSLQILLLVPASRAQNPRPPFPAVHEPSLLIGGALFKAQMTGLSPPRSSAQQTVQSPSILTALLSLPCLCSAPPPGMQSERPMPSLSLKCVFMVSAGRCY